MTTHHSGPPSTPRHRGPHSLHPLIFLLESNSPIATNFLPIFDGATPPPTAHHHNYSCASPLLLSAWGVGGGGGSHHPFPTSLLPPLLSRRLSSIRMWIQVTPTSICMWIQVTPTSKPKPRKLTTMLSITREEVEQDLVFLDRSKIECESFSPRASKYFMS